jgi:2'-5' RNA ligase
MEGLEGYGSDTEDEPVSASASSSRLAEEDLLCLVYVDAAEHQRELEPFVGALAASHKEWEFCEATEWHVSLSRPFTVGRAQAQPLVDRLSVAVREKGTKFALDVCSPSIVLKGSEKDFLCLQVRDTAEGTALIAAIDRVMQSFGLEPFFQPPCLHISVAARARTEAEAESDEDGDQTVICRLAVGEVTVRIGKDIARIPI